MYYFCKSLLKKVLLWLPKIIHKDVISISTVVTEKRKIDHYYQINIAEIGGKEEPPQ